jgi:pyruvate formate lyase activating enzyme
MEKGGGTVNQAIKRRLVLNITRMSVHNGPGVRTLILFKGCPLRCLWCSTPESQKAGPEIAVYPKKCTQCGYCVPACTLHAISLTESAITIDRTQCNSCGDCVKVCHPEAIGLLGQWMTVEEIVREAGEDSVLYKHSGGGVTISGGEPLLQPDFTGELTETLQRRGISVGVDTCGHVPLADIHQVLPYVAFFLWDIKHMDPGEHRKLTGFSNELILSNARVVSERGIPMYIRVPLIPGYNDAEENIRATCEFAATLHSVMEVHLLPLHHLGKIRYESLDRPYPLADVSLIPDNVLQDMERLVESYRLKCRIGG